VREPMRDIVVYKEKDGFLHKKKNREKDDRGEMVFFFCYNAKRGDMVLKERKVKEIKILSKKKSKGNKNKNK